ncbi:hypothetical protein JOD96_000473 [Flavobacterium sp. 1355]|nr:hypothetical protein [Flavobacterium sp. 1355]
MSGMGNWSGDRDSGGSSLGIKARTLLDDVLSRLSPYRPI